MKTTVFWDRAPCSLVEIDRRFRGVYCLHHQALIIEACRISETSGKDPLPTYPLDRMLSGPQGQSEILSSLRVIESRSPVRPVRSQTLY
jgi:hypothetical protein